MSLGHIIKKFRSEHQMSMSEFASKSGISKAYIAILEKDVNPQTGKKVVPSITIIEQAAIAMNISFDELIAQISGKVLVNSEEPTRPTRRGVTIKVLGRVAAGIPINAIEEVIDEEEIPEEMARKGEYFGLKIKGDSMAPEIKDGDTVIVRKQDDADSGDIVIAIVNGNDGCCKKLKKIENGVMLISINPAYEPMVFTQSDIDTIPVRIIGRVVEHRRKY